MTKADRGLIAIGLALGVFVVLAFLQDDGPTMLPPALVKTGDSLEATKPVLDSQLASNVAQRAASGTAGRVASSAAKAAQDRANEERARGDSLDALARALGSNAEAWRAVAESRQIENDSLRSVIRSKDTQLAHLEQDTTSLRVDLRAVNLRLAAVESHAVDLRLELEKPRPQCNTKCKLAWTAGGVLLDQVASILARK